MIPSSAKISVRASLVHARNSQQELVKSMLDLRDMGHSALASEELVWMGALEFLTIYIYQVPSASICAVLLMELTDLCCQRKLSALQRLIAKDQNISNDPSASQPSYTDLKGGYSLRVDPKGVFVQ